MLLVYLALSGWRDGGDGGTPALVQPACLPACQALAAPACPLHPLALAKEKASEVCFGFQLAGLPRKPLKAVTSTAQCHAIEMLHGGTLLAVDGSMRPGWCPWGEQLALLALHPAATLNHRRTILRGGIHWQYHSPPHCDGASRAAKLAVPVGGSSERTQQSSTCARGGCRGHEVAKPKLLG